MSYTGKSTAIRDETRTVLDNHKAFGHSTKRIIKDCIYGHIHIPDLCVKFMDTPEFQRLRRVKQLGMAHYVYPSAVHTRFEHSLGVMHLAGKMVEHLRSYAEISDRKKELVQLAGMYHDIGHFAYSHLFDKFLELFPAVDTLDEVLRLKDHEERSIYFLRQVNKRLGLLTDEEILFVERCIMGRIPHDSRCPFLYEIVCNRECGIDVDKMDYLRRDSWHTGLPAFQSDYIILSSGIDSDRHIAFREKARGDIQDLFATRRRMHEYVYQHRAAMKCNKVYFCAMRRLGHEVFKYGGNTDDYNVETLIRSSPHLCELVDNINTRTIDHDCEHCNQYKIARSIKESGTVDQVRFI